MNNDVREFVNATKLFRLIKKKKKKDSKELRKDVITVLDG